MFANRKFRDVFALMSTGILPGVAAAGSSVSSLINMGGIGKLVYELYGGSGGTASAQLLLYGATDSTGTGSKLIASTDLLFASATSASGGVAVLDVRGQFVETNSSGPWVFAVPSVSGASMAIALTAKAYLCSYNPAFNNEVPATFVKTEKLAY